MEHPGSKGNRGVCEPQSLPLNSLAFTPDGAIVASATGDWRNYQQPGDVRLWEAATGKRIASLPGYTSDIKCLAIDPMGKYLATSSSNRLVQLWNLASREELAKVRPDSVGTSLAFSSNGSRLAIGENRGGVSTWNVPALTLAARYAGHAKTVSGIAFSPDGQRLATAGHDGVVSLWPVADDRRPNETTK